MIKKIVFMACIIPFIAHADLSYTDVTDYVNRTAEDYCGKNKKCSKDFSQQLLFAYKDGEKDKSSRFKNDTLLKRYESKWKTLECSSAEYKNKAACLSMVDRIVDSYNRGLSSR